MKILMENTSLDKNEENVKQDNNHREFKFMPNEKYEHIMLSFFTYEREYYEKNKIWFFIATLFGVISIIYFIIDKAFTSAIVFILILTILYLFGNEPPKKVEIHITHNGIYINKRFFQFKDINCYWIINDTEMDIHAMYFTVGKAIIRTYAIQLVDVPDRLLRQSISDNIVEDTEKEEPAHYRFCRFFKL